VLFTYFIRCFTMGLRNLRCLLPQAGRIGVLVTYLTPRRSEDYRRLFTAQNLDTIFSLAGRRYPSDDARLQKILRVPLRDSFKSRFAHRV